MVVVRTIIRSRKPLIGIRKLLLFISFLQIFVYPIHVFEVCQVSLFLKQGLVFFEFGQDL